MEQKDNDNMIVVRVVACNAIELWSCHLTVSKDLLAGNRGDGVPDGCAVATQWSDAQTWTLGNHDLHARHMT